MTDPLEGVTDAHLQEAMDVAEKFADLAIQVTESKLHWKKGRAQAEAIIQAALDKREAETLERAAEAQAEAITAKDADIARLREALERIRDYAPEVTHGWALAVRFSARQALAIGQIETSGFADCEDSHDA